VATVVEVSPKLLVLPEAGPVKVTLLLPSVVEPPTIPIVSTFEAPLFLVDELEVPLKLFKSEEAPDLVVESVESLVALDLPSPTLSVVPVASPLVVRLVFSAVSAFPRLSPLVAAAEPLVLEEIVPFPCWESRAVAPVVPKWESDPFLARLVSVSLVVAPAALVLPAISL